MTRYEEIQQMWAARMAKRVPVELAPMPAVAVDVGKLTGSEEWDRYLSWVQPLLDEAEALCRQSQQDIFHVCAEADQRKIMNTYWYYRGVADAHAKDMTLPKEVVARAHPQPRTD